MFSLSRQDGEVYLYGIFDGHSGSKVAAFAAQRMPEEILLGQLHGKVTDDEIKDVLKQVTSLLYFFYYYPIFLFNVLFVVSTAYSCSLV